VRDDTEAAAPSSTAGAEAIADAEAPLKPGTEVAGYVIDAKIGEGGMGKVYSAHHPRIGKRVAIKVLSHAYCNNTNAVARFEQEARLVNEIRHPNIVDVFQFGELPDKRSPAPGTPTSAGCR
jgi:serine/threonine-protein kinase